MEEQEIGHIADSEIRRYLREIETNETQAWVDILVFSW